MSKVVLLGAGASCAYNESPTNITPPLANGLIKAYKKLSISENRLVLVGHLINHVCGLRGITPADFGVWDEDIEMFMTELDESISEQVKLLKLGDQNADQFGELVQTTSAYNQLIFLFACILNEIQNGPISKTHMKLAEELNPSDTCITFNWDTIFDRALLEAGKWNPITGYHVVPEGIFVDGWKRYEASSDKDEIKFLKLHGSTNWLTPYQSVDLSSGDHWSFSQYALDKLYVYMHANEPYKTFKNRCWGPYQPLSYCYYPPDLPLVRDDIPIGYVGASFTIAPDLPEHGKPAIGETDVHSMPLIVPPVRNKQYMRYGKIFSSLWSTAEEKISTCEELYIIGYSFPETDLLSKELFENGLKKNDRLREVIIWNPSPENIENLFIDKFGIQKSKIQIRKKYFELGDSSKDLL